jgi:hypothetical protein
MYEQQMNGSFGQAGLRLTNFTPIHIHPNSFQKMNVKLAMQV